MKNRGNQKKIRMSSKENSYKALGYDSLAQGLCWITGYEIAVWKLKIKIKIKISPGSY